MVLTFLLQLEVPIIEGVVGLVPFLPAPEPPALVHGWGFGGHHHGVQGDRLGTLEVWTSLRFGNNFVISFRYTRFC